MYSGIFYVYSQILYGKLQFTLTWAFGKLGRACTRPIVLFAVIYGCESCLRRSGVRTSLEYLRDIILQELPARPVLLRRYSRALILMWTDGVLED